MEELLNAMGTVAFLLVLAIGLLAGWIAGAVAGRDKALYLVLGVVGAFVTPFLVAALGLGILAASGLMVILLVAGAGALVLLVIVGLLARR
ncbi:GlsB/YeaQ/YmgE family stress response membrane protein [Psychromarinibacter sp. C21-152]|uniref:GlsB/YeaQ/YmgE family stress response membrane protein n=1 Tax=Psychromarinibacter sediminicola TaxID=3033385 RepID=A0AAE3NX13_9RHOB|nr:GlsB/YeaQ/YmgE family stress response membrane protein [Psychromarinibacter sediminicola]MDF0603799.1 GlsB/YeaQ/YmgE family stress response membrane protein [Psychromarinibacter sediminicola]